MDFGSMRAIVQSVARAKLYELHKYIHPSSYLTLLQMCIRDEDEVCSMDSFSTHKKEQCKLHMKYTFASELLSPAATGYVNSRAAATVRGRAVGNTSRVNRGSKLLYVSNHHLQSGLCLLPSRGEVGQD